MFLRYGLVLFASTLAGATANATIYTVGADEACDFAGIEAAAAAEETQTSRVTASSNSPIAR